MINFPQMVPPVGRSALHVLVIGRISTPQQNVNNIEAGYRYAEGVLQHVWKGDSIIGRLGEQGSGMLVERQMILDAYAGPPNQYGQLHPWRHGAQGSDSVPEAQEGGGGLRPVRAQGGSNGKAWRMDVDLPRPTQLGARSQGRRRAGRLAQLA